MTLKRSYLLLGGSRELQKEHGTKRVGKHQCFTGRKADVRYCFVLGTDVFHFESL